MQVWCDNEHVADVQFSHKPEVGDEMELNVNGEKDVYRVKRVYNFFSENGSATPRIAVEYAGNSVFGMIA